MNLQTVRLAREGAVVVASIDRPAQRNALNAQVRAELLSVLDACADDDGVRVLVLTGAGERAFAVGADLGELRARGLVEQREAMSGRRIFDAVAEYGKPVLAMLNGVALGGGCELALACDLRLAAETARLGQPEIHLGLIPGGGGTQRLTRLVGAGRAMRLVLTGEPVDAAEALRIGLVDYVFPAAELRERTLEIAQRLAEKSPVALRLAKRAVRAAAELPLDAGLATERELFLDAFASEDGREGVAAFLEKRPPVFRGR